MDIFWNCTLRWWCNTVNWQKHFAAKCFILREAWEIKTSLPCSCLLFERWKTCLHPHQVIEILVKAWENENWCCNTSWEGSLLSAFSSPPKLPLVFLYLGKNTENKLSISFRKFLLHKKLVYTLNIKMWIFFAQAIVKSTACATYCTDDLLWEMQSACPFSDYELKILFVWWLTKSQPKSTIMHRNHERQSNLIYLVVGRNFNLSLFKGTKKWPWQQILLHYSLSTWQIDSMLPCVCLVIDHR